MNDTLARTHLARWIAVWALLLLCLSGAAVLAATVGDQVALTATHRDGVPFHATAGGTPTFQRVPDGTIATVIGLDRGGRWLQLSLPDGRTGWVTSRDLARPATGTPSPDTSAPRTKPQRLEEGTVTRVADGDTLTVITPHRTRLRIRMVGIDAPETPKGKQFPGQPYGEASTQYLKQLVEGKRVTVEIYGVDRYRRLLSTIFLDGKDVNLAMIEAGLAEVYRGPESVNPYKQQYQAAEAKAREAQKGMWVLGDQYESPRDCRRRVGISQR